MRSLLLRILLASLATIVLSLAVFAAALIAVIGPVNERLIHHFQARQIEDLVDALGRGGPTEVAPQSMTVTESGSWAAMAAECPWGSARKTTS